MSSGHPEVLAISSIPSQCEGLEVPGCPQLEGRYTFSSDLLFCFLPWGECLWDEFLSHVLHSSQITVTQLCREGVSYPLGAGPLLSMPTSIISWALKKYPCSNPAPDQNLKWLWECRNGWGLVSCPQNRFSEFSTWGYIKIWEETGQNNYNTKLRVHPESHALKVAVKLWSWIWIWTQKTRMSIQTLSLP